MALNYYWGRMHFTLFLFVHLFVGIDGCGINFGVGKSKFGKPYDISLGRQRGPDVRGLVPGIPLHNRNKPIHRYFNQRYPRCIFEYKDLPQGRPKANWQPAIMHPRELADVVREKSSSSDGQVVIIDLRDRDYINGRIRGARHVPSRTFAIQARSLALELKV